MLGAISAMASHICLLFCTQKLYLLNRVTISDIYSLYMYVQQGLS